MANGNGGQQAANGTGSYPITRTFAILALLALAWLVITRHLFGVIRVEAGAK